MSRCKFAQAGNEKPEAERTELVGGRETAETPRRDKFRRRDTQSITKCPAQSAGISEITLISAVHLTHNEAVHSIETGSNA